MGRFIGQRLLLMVPTLVLVSVVSFVIIQLPPGDYLNTYAATLEASGDLVDAATLEALKAQYGLDDPFHVQYLKWVSGFVRGDFGHSFEQRRPVGELVGDRLLLTVVISLSTLLFTWVVAIPVGIYSATAQYSLSDYTVTFLGFVGLATPNFLLALILMYVGYRYLDISVGGLFSMEFIDAPWSLARVLDLVSHLWIPIIVVGTGGTAGLIRVMRANLLDELRKQYVITARSRGVAETRLLFKYPVRLALNPIVSSVGWLLPELISGAEITAVVLSLPTTGPLLLRALLSQDMYLAGTFVMFLAALTVIGTLVSDVLLAIIDPRIRFGRRGD